ncbi:hypothetical protein KNE206_53250 [Kitasatospora sp. NE20-6]|uniref:hypothetical protein n=1 Tax=Kitasatospora sp. NE20-6 TaxID=2859066 RepID=UPI0034DBC621
MDVDFALAALEPAGPDDATGARLLHHSGLAFEQRPGGAADASAYLGIGNDLVLAAWITRNQRAGTYTVRLHRAADTAEALQWLQSTAPAPGARRAAALFRSPRIGTATREVPAPQAQPASPRPSPQR